MLDGTSTGEGLITAGDVAWTDYVVSTQGKMVEDAIYTNKELTLVTRFQNVDNFYWMGLGAWNHRVSISKKVNGTTQELVFAGVDTELIADQPYSIQAKVIGNTIQLYVNGNLELETTDSSLTNGAIGIRTYNGHVKLDFIEATTPPTPSDISIPLLAIAGTLSLLTNEPLPIILAGAYVVLRKSSGA